MRIVATDRAASALGITLGMTLVTARAQKPDLEVRDHDPQADDIFLNHLAQACEIFTPLVALDGRHGLMLDITGCAHLFGGEVELRLRVCHRLARFRVEAFATLAGTPDAAHALVRFASVAIVMPERDGDAARSLPVDALEMGKDTSLALIRAGLKTLGDLADRPSTVLAARFGMALTQKLGRIFGQDDWRITPLRSLPDCIAERHFVDPVAETDTILDVLEKLAIETNLLMERRALGGRLFEISLFRSDGVVRRLAIETGQAIRDAGALTRLIRLRIETLADALDPGFGFDALRLSVLRSEALAPVQKRLEGGEEGDLAVAELVDRLITRFGRSRVLHFAAHDTHDPVRASALVSVVRGDRPEHWPEQEPGEPPLRPLTLFDPPQPVEALAEVPDGPPMRFRWRRVLHEVTRAEGPERIAPEWWFQDHVMQDHATGQSELPTRDYYRVEDRQGRRFWLFREGLFEDQQTHRGQHPRWYMHGLFA